MEASGKMEINKVYNENCLLTMSKMDDDFVDLVVISPPYDNIRDYKGFYFPFDDIVDQLYRVIKPGGVVVWVVGDTTKDCNESGTSFTQALQFKKCGFNLHDTMIYMKNGPAYPSKNRYYAIFEYMFVFTKGKLATFNPLKDRPNKWAGQKWSNTRSRRDSKGVLHISTWSADQGGEFGVRFNVWKYNVGHEYSTKDIVAYEHPAIFPEKLAEDHIVSWSNEGDLIYDPFMGSGTTAKMAILNKRNYIGSEISREYCDIANKRLEMIPNA